MTNPNILQIVSRFPMGIQGVDLRFALQISYSEFSSQIVQHNIMNNIHIEGSLDDLDQCIFTFQSNMVFRHSPKVVVSNIVLDIHRHLQRYPQGLTLEELSSRIPNPQENLSEVISKQALMEFVEQNYEIDNPPIRSVLSEDVYRLVQRKQLAMWMGSSPARTITLSSILLFILSALLLF